MSTIQEKFLIEKGVDEKDAFNFLLLHAGALREGLTDVEEKRREEIAARISTVLNYPAQPDEVYRHLLRDTKPAAKRFGKK